MQFTIETNYPWSGAVRFIVDPEASASFAVSLRIPGWCKGFEVQINGAAIHDASVDKGYVHIYREWGKGDELRLDLDMPIEQVHAHPKVAADQGRAALQRGPLVYCVEGVDHEGGVDHIALSPSQKWSVRHDPALLGGVTVLEAVSSQSIPGTQDTEHDSPVPFMIRAIPYYSWDNREPGPMAVWLPEVRDLETEMRTFR